MRHQLKKMLLLYQQQQGPDCLDKDVLDYLEELNKKTYLWVELGLQTINDNTARNFNRGYDLECI